MKMLCCGIITPKRETAEQWAGSKRPSLWRNVPLIAVEGRQLSDLAYAELRYNGWHPVQADLRPLGSCWAATLTETQP